jgi:hypothetical protein
MQNRFHAGYVFSLCILILLCAPWLRSQQVDEKNSPEAAAPEQKAHAHSGGPCDLTACPARFFYLSNLSQPTELQDFVNALRTIGEIARIQQIPSEQLVIVRGTPEQLALAEKLADEINKDKRRFGGVGYRLDFKVSESEGDKKLRPRVYSLLTDGRETAKLRIERPAPAPAQSDLATESKASKQSPVPAGQNIECHVVAENERTIELHVDAAFSSSGAPEPGKAAGSPDPTLFRVKNRVILELGKPTVISVLDDPDSERTFHIEVTATRIKERQ